MKRPKGYVHHNGYYDPDPNNNPFNIGTAIALIGAIISGLAYFKPDFLKSLILAMNPTFEELDEDIQKRQTEFYKTMFLIVAVICGIYIASVLIQHQKAKKMRGMMRIG